MEQLMALGVVPRHPDSATIAFAALKEELAKEKAARQTTQVEDETHTRAMGDLKISADIFQPSKNRLSIWTTRSLMG
jgi:hypothetical protein